MKNVPVRIFSCEGVQQKLKMRILSVIPAGTRRSLQRIYRVAVGDYVAFGNVGGYSIVDKPPFIQPNCQWSLSGQKQNVKEKNMG